MSKIRWLALGSVASLAGCTLATAMISGDVHDLRPHIGQYYLEARLSITTPNKTINVTTYPQVYYVSGDFGNSHCSKDVNACWGYDKHVFVAYDDEAIFDIFVAPEGESQVPAKFDVKWKEVPVGAAIAATAKKLNTYIDQINLEQNLSCTPLNTSQAIEWEKARGLYKSMRITVSLTRVANKPRRVSEYDPAELYLANLRGTPCAKFLKRYAEGVEVLPIH